ncbi:MAG: response regulator [Pseudomonadota bacterium]
MLPSDTSILYLEDEIIIALDTTQTLKDMGFRQVHVVHNLRRAAAAAQSEAVSFECALLDVNIAGEGLSLDFGRGLMDRGVAVVFASGYNRHEMEAEHSGLTFVEKPLNAATIAAAFARFSSAA